MALAVTGYLSSPGYGLCLDLHEGISGAADLAELHRFGADAQNELYVLDVPRYDQSLPNKIGQAVLSSQPLSGCYEATYDLGEDALKKWGRKGLMTESMHVLLGRLIEQDIHASTLELWIATQNKPSIGLAKKLGAQLVEGTETFYNLSLADYHRSRVPVRGRVTHG